MGNAADTLVSKHPSRIAQLKGPVYKYLAAISKNLKFNGTDQDLYMAIFYPAYRRKPVNMLLPDHVRKVNPFRTSGDYINKVNAQTNYVNITKAEMTALKEVSSKLGISWESLYKQILHESGWDPKAKNKLSGARGLIQFMPNTAKGMGYKSSLGIGGTILLAGVSYIALKELQII